MIWSVPVKEAGCAAVCSRNSARIGAADGVGVKIQAIIRRNAVTKIDRSRNRLIPDPFL
jgi:hypothetical protein